MAENSNMRAKGVGKNAKRHDLDGTPGLHVSSLQQGDVKKFENGQEQVANTRGSQVLPTQAQQAPQGGGLPAQERPMEIPDPVTLASKKIGGNLQGAGTATLERKQFDRWLPLLRRLSQSPTSSGILQRAYLARMTAEMARPTGGSATVIRQRDFDKRLEEFNDS